MCIIVVQMRLYWCIRGGGIPNAKELLKNKLPEYMIPQRIIHCDTMLFNVNGKVDRNAIYKTVWE